MVTVSVLAALFLASFIALLILCRNKYCNRAGSTEAERCNIITPAAVSATVDEMEAAGISGHLELGDIVTCDDGTLRDLLETEDWAFDAQGLIPHCLTILKMCKEITKKLVVNTLRNEKIYPTQLEEIVQVAQRITPRVDDLMTAIHPPLNPSLLEARAAALIFSVSHLALVIKSSCKSKKSTEWIDQAMIKMDEHMKILREIAVNPALSDKYNKSDEAASSSEALDFTKL